MFTQRLSAFFFVLWLLSGAVEANTEIPATTGSAVLGQGYNTDEQKYRGMCNVFDSKKIIYAGGAETLSGFSNQRDSQSAQDSLGFAMNTRVRFGVTSASLSAQFAKETQADSYSQTVTYRTVSTFKDAKLINPELVDFAKKELGSGGFATDNFFKDCGNEVITTVHRGAALYFSISISFTSQSEKQRFSGSFNLDNPMVSVAADIKKASSQFGDSASVQIVAYQKGGDPTRLGKVFTSGSSVGSDGVHALLRCSMSSLTPCLQVITNAIVYATDPVAADGFPQQLKSLYNPENPNGPADMGYVSEPWSNFGIHVKPVILQELIQAKRKQLGEAFERQLVLQNRLSFVTRHPRRLTTTQQDLFDSYVVMVGANLGDIQTAVETCYTDDQKCAKAVDVVETEIAKRRKTANFDETKLDMQPERFAQWCDYVGYVNPGLIPPTPAFKSTRDTVTMLVDEARRRYIINGSDAESWKKVQDQCGYAGEILEQADDFSVPPDTVLLDLRPLTSLHNLRRLVLRSAAIDDRTLAAAGFSESMQLIALDLTQNNLQSVAPLSKLKLLQALTVSSNHILDLSPLGVLPALKTLIATGNPIDKKAKCPLTAPGHVCLF